MKTTRAIGGIQIFAEIHAGATTLVFKGYQPALDRMVLLKVLRPEFNHDADLARRFDEEARLTAKIQHPNVAAIYDYGRDGDWRYFAAEFVEGFNLGEIIQRRKLPPELAAFILLESARGLKAAHDKNILHRDLKPSNILISHEGQVKLTDFGMASLRPSAGQQLEEKISGTLAYLAPEQILGKPASQASDIFSLGATFFEMVTGEPAFAGKNPGEIFEAILHADPFSKISSAAFPEIWRRICAKMLASDADPLRGKDPAQRYGDCGALIKDIETAGVSANSSDLKNYLLDPLSYTEKVVIIPGSVSMFSPTAAESARSGFPRLRGQAIPNAAWRRVWPAAVAIILIVVVAIIGFSFLQKKEKVDLREDQQTALLPPSDSSAIQNNHSKFVDAPKPTTAAALLQTEITPPEKKSEAQVISAMVEEDSTKTAPTAAGNVTPAFGYLNIICTPWAAVLINGDSLTTTPLRSPIKLPPGRHELILRNPEFPEFKQMIELHDENTTIEISLWSLVGTLKLEVSPWAEVYVDGEYKDTVPPQKRPLILSPGQHVLALKHPQLGSWETVLDISAGKNLEMKFNLQTLLSK
jgi:serine/threonine-protein kinase